MLVPWGPEAALLCRDLVSFYRAHWLEGRLSLCEEATLRERGRRLLPGPAKRTLGLGGLAGKEARLAPALGFLELLCVHLALAPWRKEARALKTFTGNFVYYVRSVLPEEVVERLLGKIGYVATTATEFTLIRKLNQEEAEQIAFELFLARIECENLDVAEDTSDSDLGDLRQERAQEHWSPGEDLDKKQQPTQSKEYVFARGESEAQDDHGPQETYLTQSTLALKRPENPELRSEVSHRCPTEDLQTAISKHFPEPNTNQRSVDVSSNFCVKSSDSEDFLIKYSDIVIGQKPLQLTDLSPKASANETRATGFIETGLGPAADGAQLATLLSPDASGPQALAILNNGTLGNHRLYDYRTQETDESNVCSAMNCLGIYGADPTDQPKELKGNTVQHSNMHTGCNLSREEDPCDLFCNNKLKIKLMYPVEETTQLEQRTSRSANQEVHLSGMKLEDPPGRKRGGFNINSYSSPDLFCNITSCECPAVDSAYNKLVVGNPGTSGAGEISRNVGEQPTSSYAVAPKTLEHGGLTAILQCKQEGCPLHSSFADFNTCLAPVSETNPEGYVIINKDD
ncbi:spermatogenesis-associated protein 2-like [Anolis sagrei]|uniref:spermatogenesis-associated protein 2-like n=1 Tax=Anolis sagrei TaxID=38937 RepID=UPI003521C68F